MFVSEHSDEVVCNIIQPYVTTEGSPAFFSQFCYFREDCHNTGVVSLVSMDTSTQQSVMVAKPTDTVYKLVT